MLMTEKRRTKVKHAYARTVGRDTSRPQIFQLAIVVVAFALVGVMMLRFSRAAGTISPSNISGTPTLNVFSPDWFVDYPGGVLPRPTQPPDLSIAKNFNLIVDQGPLPSQGYFYNNAPAMKAANPKLRMLVYVNGIFRSSQDNKSYPESAYAHTASGGHIQSGSTGNTMMNPRSPEWTQSRVDFCKAFMVKGYDGCMLDTSGYEGATNFVSGTPVIPGTNTAYSEQQWGSDMLDMVNRMRSFDNIFNTGLITGNNLSNGKRYVANPPTSFFVTDTASRKAYDGAVSETFLRQARANNPPFPSAAEWKQNVDMVKDFAVNKPNKIFMATTKEWDSTATPQSKRDQWHLYSMGTFLMGACGRQQAGCNTFWNFVEDGYKETTSIYWDWWNFDIGNPASTYGQIGSTGVYGRQFDKGYVAVNPDSASHSFSLPAGTYSLLTGGTVSGSVNLAGNSGMVYIGGNGGGGGGTVAPSITFTAAPGTINNGGSSILSWSVSGTSPTCTATQGWTGAKPVSGTATVSPASTTTYGLSCGNSAGTDTKSVTVTVNAGTTAPVVTLSSSPTSITSGNSSTLTWSTTGTSPACTASGGWSGSKNASGTQTVSPNNTTSYSLSCTNSAGSDSKTATVTVTSSVVAPVVTLNVSPSSITNGNSSTLTWSVTGTSPTCAATGGWSGSKGTSGSASVSPGTTTSYTLTCTNSAGNDSKTATVTVTQTSIPPEDVNQDGRVDIQDISSVIAKYGQTSGLGRADINGDGKVSIQDISMVIAKYGT